MNREEALEFLRQHQPMPDDHEMPDEVLQGYVQACDYFEEFPDVASVPLFLNSFGYRSGFEAYESVTRIIEKQPPEVVVPHLIAALKSPFPGVRMWSAYIAWDFSSPELIPPLSELLSDPDLDICCPAAVALKFIKGQRAVDALRAGVEQATDPIIRHEMEEILQELLDNH